MPYFRRLLVPVDLSNSDRSALRHAVRLAQRAHAELHLLHVVEDVPEEEQADSELLSAAKERLRQLAAVEVGRYTQKVSGQGLHVVQHVMGGKKAASVIVKYAISQSVDLIAMGTRGRQGRERLIVGSTAEHVVRFAPCSVLTVGPRGGWLPGTVRRVVAAVDLTTASVDVVRWARILASFNHARLDIVHVVEPFIQPVSTGSRTNLFSLQGGRGVDEVRSEMKRLYARAGGPHVTVRYHTVRGRPAKQIVQLAEAEQSHLIVQGTRGYANRTGAARLGSVADKVVRTAPCPVFTCRPSVVDEPAPKRAATEQGV